MAKGMTQLNTICKKYVNITDKCTKHSYCDVYNDLFNEYKTIENAHILEIGVAAGGSIFMWLDYFSNGIIYGIDIKDMPDALKKNKPDRYHHYLGDAYSNEIADSLPSFDIIIDDGPHTEQSFQSLIDLYSKKINNNGLIIIEDVDFYNHNIEKIVDYFPSNFLVSVVDLRYKNNIGDDILIIGKKIQ
jgi:hypothetical protein